MAKYEIELQTKAVERKWPFGLRKKINTISIPLGILEEGEMDDLFFSNGEKACAASVDDGQLTVTLQDPRHVLIDMGKGQEGYYPVENIVLENGVEQHWIRTLQTNGDMTIRKEDGSHAVLIRRPAKGGADA